MQTKSTERRLWPVRRDEELLLYQRTRIIAEKKERKEFKHDRTGLLQQ